jgi:hypothetical protein
MCILYVNKNIDIKLNAHDTYNTQQNTVFKMVNISIKSCLLYYEKKGWPYKRGTVVVIDISKYMYKESLSSDGRQFHQYQQNEHYKLLFLDKY